MIRRFMRKDLEGNLVKVEIAMDETGKPFRLRRETTSAKYKNITVREDVYFDKEPKQFKKCLKEEMAFQARILISLSECLEAAEENITN